MADDNKVIAILELDGKLFEAQLTRAEAVALTAGKKIGEKLGTAAAKESGKSFSAAATGFFTAGFNKVFDGLISGFQQIGTLLSSAIKEAKHDSDSLFSLNTALAAAGNYSKQASEELEHFSESLSKVSIFSSSAINDALALGQAFGLTTDKTKDMVQAAANLSAVTGEDLKTSVQKLGLTLTGSAGRLAVFIPGLNKVSESALKAGAAIDFINNRFSGQAAAKINTFSGAMLVLENRFNAMLAAVGKVVIQSPAFISLFKLVSVEIEKFIKGFAGISSTNDIVGEIIIKLIQFATVLNNYVVLPVEIAVNAIKLAFNAIRVIIQETVISFTELIGSFVHTFAPNSAAYKSIKNFYDGLLEVQDGFLVQTKESFKGLGDTSTFEGIDAALIAVADRTRSAMANNSEAQSAFVNGTKDTLGAVGGLWADFAKDIDSVVNGLVIGGIASLGAALVQGGKAFGDFAKIGAGLLGDFFIKMGTTIIMADAAMIALKASLVAFPGGLGIAAGIGLVIAGGALKALAGAGGGGSRTVPAASAANQPATGIAGSTSQPSNLAAATDLKKAEAQTNVTINVSGVVTDPRGTAKQIADILKGGFKTNGINVTRVVV